MWRFLLVLAGCEFSTSLAPPTDTVDSEGTSTNAGFRRRIDITDALVTGSHTSFPLLVVLDGDWVKSVANGGHVANADGSDIRFSTDPDGNMPLLRDFEVYAPGTGSLVAWVEVPTLMPSTVLYVHYGDPARTASGDPRAVWTKAGYAGVWHLHPQNTDASGQSSTFVDMSSMATSGKISAGRQFDATDDYIDVGSAAIIDNVFVGGGTAEAWFRATTAGENGAARIVDKGVWLITFNNGAIRFYSDWTSTDGDWVTAAVSLNQWHHVAVVYNGATVATIYLDGVAASTQTSTPNGSPIMDADETLQFGNRFLNDRTFDGIIDEVRISTGMRAASWIATSHENQKSPAAFYTLGDEEQR